MVTNQILLSLTLAIAAMFFLWKQTFMANGSNIVSLIRYNHGSLSSIKRSRCRDARAAHQLNLGRLVSWFFQKMLHGRFNTKSVCIPQKSSSCRTVHTPNFTSHLKTSPFKSTVQINHHGFSFSNFVSFCLGVVDSNGGCVDPKVCQMGRCVAQQNFIYSCNLFIIKVQINKS